MSGTGPQKDYRITLAVKAESVRSIKSIEKRPFLFIFVSQDITNSANMSDVEIRLAKRLRHAAPTKQIASFPRIPTSSVSQHWQSTTFQHF